MLWVDKHRPKTLESVDYHKNLSERLQHMAHSGDIPHMLFYGPPGSGKKTRVMCTLRQIYGSGVDKMKYEYKTIKTPSGRKIEVISLASNYHIELNPADAGIYDTYIVQEVIKEMAASRSLDSKHAYKVLVITEVDRLTKQAQAALRRTMEKYSSSCRLVLCCLSPSKVIDPIRSRCLGIRVPSPTQKELMDVLQKVCTKENIHLPQALAARVALLSQRNVRRAILMLETCRVQQFPFTRDQTVQITDWERYISFLANDIIQEQTPNRVLMCRQKLYELLSNCIPADVILKTLCTELYPKVDDTMKHEISHWAAHYEHSLQVGSKEVFHLEAFIVRVMSLYKQFLLRGGAQKA